VGVQTAKQRSKSMSPVTTDRPQTGEETFSALLRRLMKSRRLSVALLAARSWLDSAYVWRLTREEIDILNRRVGDGRIRHPSRDAVIKLGLGLGLGVDEMDELLLAAGYAPLVR
jgi:hypothetical protein